MRLSDQDAPPLLDGQCIHKFGLQNLLCDILQRDSYYELCHDSKDFPCSFKKVANPRKPKPSPVSAAPKVEAFDMIANDFSDDYSGLKNYVILPSRDRTESEAPPFNDSRIQDEKASDNPTVRRGE
jgi:hypothetical protein